MQKKLKVAYTLVEQLYTSAQQAICIVAHNKQPPTLVKDTLERLPMLPPRIAELKKSAARAGTLTALTQAKARRSDLEPADLANGYPSVKEDGSPFSAKGFS